MSSGDSFELFLDLMSQPSRACALLCRVNNLNVTERQVLIHKHQHLAPEHLARNPLGKIPVLVRSYADGTPPFRLPESAAIMTYLASSFTDQVPEHYLPRSNLEARAHVEAAMHWYHSSIRAGAMRLVFHKVLAAKLGAHANDAIATEGAVILRRALQDLEGVWLQGGSLPFIGGAKPCMADLLVSCELEQLNLLNKEDHGVDMEQLLADRPVTRRWLAEVAAATAPHYEQVHAILRKASNRNSGGKPQPEIVHSRM